MKSTRNMLAFGLCALALAVGLVTCFVQARNHARAQELARLQRQWEMLDAANAQVGAVVAAHVDGVPNGPAQPKPHAAKVRE
jgi:uncharacterized protein HemX